MHNLGCRSLCRSTAAEKEGIMANYNKYADNNSNGPIEFKLVEKLGILERHKSGWCREINIVAWNGGRPKFDIRDWDRATCFSTIAC